jgi:hypothetical protein
MTERGAVVLAGSCSGDISGRPQARRSQIPPPEIMAVLRGPRTAASKRRPGKGRAIDEALEAIDEGGAFSLAGVQTHPAGV